jgi:hypothetical protein
MAAAKVASSKVVKYIGTADVREIDAAAWKNAGVEDQHKVVWSAANNWQVSVDDLTPDAVNYCDTNDTGFVITDAV